MKKAILLAVVLIAARAPGVWAQTQWTDWGKILSIDILHGQHASSIGVPANGPRNASVSESLDGLFTYPYPENDSDNEVIKGTLWVGGSIPCPYVEVTEAMVRGGQGNAAVQGCTDINLSGANNVMAVAHSNYDPNSGMFFHTANYRVHAWDPGSPNPHGPGHE